MAIEGELSVSIALDDVITTDRQLDKPNQAEQIKRNKRKSPDLYRIEEQSITWQTELCCGITIKPVWNVFVLICGLLFVTMFVVLTVVYFTVPYQNYRDKVNRINEQYAAQIANMDDSFEECYFYNKTNTEQGSRFMVNINNEQVGSYNCETQAICEKFIPECADDCTDGAYVNCRYRRTYVLVEKEYQWIKNKIIDLKRKKQKKYTAAALFGSFCITISVLVSLAFIIILWKE